MASALQQIGIYDQFYIHSIKKNDFFIASIVDDNAVVDIQNSGEPTSNSLIAGPFTETLQS